MSNSYGYILLALLAGAMIPMQAGANNRMAEAVGNPLLASLISFSVGTMSVFVYVMASGTPIGNLASAKDASMIAWLGGVMGAFFVTATVLLVPKLGVAATFSLVIAGQMLLTIVIDHFGLLGVPVQPVSLGRVAAILLVIVGVALIRKF